MTTAERIKENHRIMAGIENENPGIVDKALTVFNWAYFLAVAVAPIFAFIYIISTN